MLNEEQQAELYLLTFRERYWFYVSGIFLGQALNVALIHLVVEQVTPFALFGILMAGGALASWQYSGHLKAKIQQYIEEHRKNENIQVK